MLVLEGHTGVVSCLAYTPDGRMLVSGGRDGAVCLWDPLAGQLVRTCRTNGLGVPVSSVAVSPSGGLVAAGLASGGACTWFAGDGVLYRRYLFAQDHTARYPIFVAFTPDGERLVTACRHEVGEWSLDADQRLRALALPHDWLLPAANSLACAGDGRIAVGYINAALIWPLRANINPDHVHWPSGDIASLAFAPNGTLLAVARGRFVGLWEPRPGRHRLLREMRHDDQVRACAFTPDGRWLLSAGDDWTMHLWDVATGEERGSFNWRLGPIVSLAVAPDGMTAAVAGRLRPGILLFDLE